MTRHDTSVNAYNRKNPTFDLAFRQHVRHYIDTAWMMYLSPTETKVLSLLCARTIYWGKVWEVVTARHLTDGCDGQFSGTGLTKKTVLSCLGKLLADGFIRRKRAGNTWAYSVNVLAMGTDSDPVRVRQSAHRVRLSEAREFRVVKARAMRDLTRRYEETRDPKYLQAAKELGAKKRAEGGCKISTLRGYIIPPPSESGTDCSSYSPTARFADGNTGGGAPASEEDTDLSMLPKKREKKSGAGETADATGEDTPLPRKRPTRVVMGATKDNPAARRAVQHVRDTAEPAPQSEPAAVPAQAKYSADRMHEETQAVQRRGAARRAARRRTNTTPGKLESTWREAMEDHYHEPGQLRWGPGNRARAKSILTIHAALPDAGMSWVDVLEWYVREYGRAVKLAVPFMAKTEEQRADILTTPPRLSLFLHFAKEFMEAYHRQHYGAGYPEVTYEAADELQRYHEQWVERRCIAAVEGVKAVPLALRTEDELLAEAKEAAPQDEELGRVMQEVDVFDDIDRHLRNTGATRQARDQEISRAGTMMHRHQTRDQYEENLAAVRDDQRESVRQTYGEELTDEECDEILREMYEDQD